MMELISAGGRQSVPLLPTTWNWEAIGAWGGLIAALAACFALWQAATATTRQIAHAKVARRGEHYDAIVRETMMPAIDEFARSTRRLVKEAAREVRTLVSSDPQYTAVDALLNSTITSFTDDYYDLRAVLSIAAVSWDSPGLKDAIQTCLDALQDEAVASIAQFPKSCDSQEQFVNILANFSAGVRRALLDHDPVLYGG